ncbi:MAG: methionyl-tRNA formyltransferase [Candidatus Cloacimonetes bacterium]|nr:methionyl-tRNA formyltransferase [Candidatus Cloacimonadota bacterium]
MKINNIVFMGTPEFAVPSLKALSETKYKPKLCITQPDRPKGRSRKLKPSPVKTIAEKYQIPLIQPENVNSPTVISSLKEIAPEIIITVAYGSFLKKEFRRLPIYGCLNLHPSLLPKFRGSAPINYALFNGDKITGNTIFKIIAKMDAGPIMSQTEIEIKPNDCYTSLSKKLAEKGALDIIKTLQKMEETELKTYDQDQTKATYSHKLLKKDFLLNWQDTADNIRNRVRGLAESPGITAAFREKRIKIIEVELLKSTSKKLPGSIINVNKHGIRIATQDEDILIKKVQPAGKKIMTAYAFSMGARIRSEDCFTDGF